MTNENILFLQFYLMFNSMSFPCSGKSLSIVCLWPIHILQSPSPSNSTPRNTHYAHVWSGAIQPVSRCCVRLPPPGRETPVPTNSRQGPTQE